MSINKLKNLGEQTENREQTDNSKPEATLIPVDSRGERANYRANCSDLILQKKIRKFAKNKHTDIQTDRQTETDRHTDRQTENSITEAPLIPCGSLG